MAQLLLLICDHLNTLEPLLKNSYNSLFHQNIFLFLFFHYIISNRALWWDFPSVLMQVVIICVPVMLPIFSGVPNLAWCPDHNNFQTFPEVMFPIFHLYIYLGTAEPVSEQWNQTGLTEGLHRHWSLCIHLQTFILFTCASANQKTGLGDSQLITAKTLSQCKHLPA